MIERNNAISLLSTIKFVLLLIHFIVILVHYSLQEQSKANIFVLLMIHFIVILVILPYRNNQRPTSRTEKGCIQNIGVVLGQSLLEQKNWYVSLHFQNYIRFLALFIEYLFYRIRHEKRRCYLIQQSCTRKLTIMRKHMSGSHLKLSVIM